MMTHIFKDWHFWWGTQFIASDENTKTLYAFDSVDECINWLYMNSHKDAARSLNDRKREEKRPYAII